MVKQFFKTHSEINLPKNVDIRNLPKTPLKMITRKPIIPTQNELKDNSRSHSAKLRVAEKQV